MDGETFAETLFGGKGGVDELPRLLVRSRPHLGDVRTRPQRTDRRPRLPASRRRRLARRLDDEALGVLPGVAQFVNVRRRPVQGVVDRLLNLAVLGLQTLALRDQAIARLLGGDDAGVNLVILGVENVDARFRRFETGETLDPPPRPSP